MNSAPTPRPPVVPPPDSTSTALSDALRASFLIVRFVMVALVILFFASGIFTVQPSERALVLRFGKVVGLGENALKKPGVHFALPYPVDEVVKIPVGQIQVASSTVGWYATTPELEAARTEPPPNPTLNPVHEGYTLTADANIIHVRAMLRYRVKDPVRYVFNFVDAGDFVTNALNHALNFAAARFTVDDALTRNATGFRERVRARLEEVIEAQGLGVSVEQMDVQALPPRQLRDRFNAVLEAGVKRDKLMNEARSFENEVLSKARGESSARTNVALADRSRLVETVAAEAKKFEDLLPEYRRNPALFKRLRQTETLATVLTNVQEKIYLPARADGQPRELRLLLSREPMKPMQKAEEKKAVGDGH